LANYRLSNIDIYPYIQIVCMGQYEDNYAKVSLSGSDKVPHIVFLVWAVVR